jgi:capsular polysaccharide biosynthesis protein
MVLRETTSKIRMKKDEKDSFYILPFIIRNAKIIIGFPLTAALLAGILTFFAQPQYYSYAIVFPPSGNSMEHTIENPNFGYDIEADRLLQILQSTELIDSVSRKFNLVAYYKLDTSKIDWRDALNDKIKKDIKFERTRYMSIELSATTTDPIISAGIVNYILSVVDKIRDRIYKINIASTTAVLKEEYRVQKSESDSLLSQISKKGKIGQGFLLNQDKEGKYNIAIEKSGDILLGQLINQYIYEQNRTNEIHSKYEKARNQLNRPIPAVYVVDRAAPSFKKIAPSYLKNIILAFLGTIFICSIVVYLKEELYSIRSKK